MRVFILVVGLVGVCLSSRTKLFDILNEKDREQLKRFNSQYLDSIQEVDLDYINEFSLKKEFIYETQYVENVETEQGTRHSEKIVELKQASILVDEKMKQLIFTDVYSGFEMDYQLVCAQIRYKDQLNQTGWDSLYIQTNPRCDLGLQMWTAGFLEGYLTSFKIQYFYSNLIKQHEDEGKQHIDKVFSFYQDVENNIREKGSRIDQIDDQFEKVYYSQLLLLQLQADGMLVGYNQNHFIKMTMSQLYFINGDGQISELISIFKSGMMKRKPELFRMKTRSAYKQLDIQQLLKNNNVKDLYELYDKSLMKGHCSVLMKLIKDQNNLIEDFLLSHQTWDDYSQMLRIFKQYNINSNQMTFPSYPGCMSSTDDWYNNKIQTSNNDRQTDEQNQKTGHIIVTETTLEVMNPNIYNYLVDYDHYVPDFMRILLANRLGYDGKTWAFWMEFINTGTYNSQWMIFDIKKAKASKGKTSLQNNTFVMFEQMPGEFNIKFQDMSSYLNQHQYFASYNIPYQSQIRKESGYDDLSLLPGGEQYQYDTNPRAILFKDNQQQVKNIEGLKWIMQLNNYSPDLDLDQNKLKLKLSSIQPSYQFMDNPGHQIASRFDLMKKDGKNTGATDTKAINLQLAIKSQHWAISGPTHQKQPYFRWSTSSDKKQHLGQPDQWNFEWQFVDFSKTQRNRKIRRK